MATVKPVGVFGPTRQTGFHLDKATLLAQGTIAKSGRKRVANYLRSGAIVFPFMEYTTDVIDGSFGVSGGSGILTDGTYYWRADAADYVEHHGIALESELLSWMEQNGWQAPYVSPEDVLLIDAYLFALLSS